MLLTEIVYEVKALEYLVSSNHPLKMFPLSVSVMSGRRMSCDEKGKPVIVVHSESDCCFVRVEEPLSPDVACCLIVQGAQQGRVNGGG